MLALPKLLDVHLDLLNELVYVIKAHLAAFVVKIEPNIAQIFVAILLYLREGLT